VGRDGRGMEETAPEREKENMLEEAETYEKIT
jgi:hypothetical protein